MSRLTALITFLAVTAVMPNGAIASLVTSIGASDPIFVGQTGRFEVFLENTAIGPDATAIQYQVGFDIVAPDDPVAPFEASFTGAISTGGTTAPYIFPTSFGALVTDYEPSDPTLITYGDFSSSPGTPQPINAGDRFSLGYVFFTGTTPGTYTVNFTEALIDNVPIGTTGTTITILPAAVPEPTTTLLLILTGVAGLFFARFRRGRLPGPVAG